MNLLEKKFLDMTDEELEQHVKELRELATKSEEVLKLITGKKRKIASKKPELTGDLLKTLGF
jgi:hypothetical protein